MGVFLRRGRKSPRGKRGTRRNEATRCLPPAAAASASVQLTRVGLDSAGSPRIQSAAVSLRQAKTPPAPETSPCGGLV